MKDYYDLKLTDQQIDDLLSALSYFMESYRDQKGSVETRKEMANLSRIFWDIKNKRKSKVYMV